MAKHFLNLGAGVQSKTMLCMAINGEILPRPDAVLFADTQDEPQYVYKEVTYLSGLCRDAGIPFHVVTKGRLSDSIWKSNIQPRQEVELIFINDEGKKKYSRFIQIPTFGSRGGMGRRQCTREFKIEPLLKKKRELAGYVRYERIPVGAWFSWVGISTDEATRIRDSRYRYEILRYPLIEKRMSRQDCINWLLDHGFTVPKKSACVYCPFHSTAGWRDIKQDPESWAKVVQIDRLLNKRGEYLHRSLRPIDEVDFSSLEDMGQINMFENECEGMCGV